MIPHRSTQPDVPYPAHFAGAAPLAGNGEALIIAEGPESALAIWQATGCETWAVFGVSGWKTAPIPGDRPVILAPDRDAPRSPAGRAFARAVLHHQGCGRAVSIAEAPEPAGSKRDLADTLLSAGPGAVRAAIAGAIPPDIEDMKARAETAPQRTPETTTPPAAGTGRPAPRKGDR